MCKGRLAGAYGGNDVRGRRNLLSDDDVAALAPKRGLRDIWLSAMPVIAIVLIVLLIGILQWVLGNEESESQRVTLISDALWVEQTLRFQLATDEDTLSRLALDAERSGLTAPEILERARLHVANNSEVLSIAWFDRNGTLQAAVPGLPQGAAVPDALLQTLERTRFSARPVYGNLRSMPDGTLVVDMAVSARSTTGTIVATISVTSLVARQIPWWIAEKYAVRLVDSAGTVLAEKAQVEPLDPNRQYQISFDPPLRGTVLVIAPYRLASEFSYRLLVGSILGLAGLAVLSLIVLQRHVSGRRKVEQRLEAETAFRRAMEDSLTIGMRARDHQGRILYVNAAFERMVGIPIDDLVGQSPPMPYWIKDRIAETLARHEQLANSDPKPQSFETRFRRVDGTEFDVLVYEAPLIDTNGVHRGWMGSIIDITDRKAAADLARGQAENLARTGRLVVLGEMASTLAHELNQPLAAIASYATGTINLLEGMQLETGGQKETILAAQRKLAAQAERAGQIIRRIQDFVRKREPRYGPVVIGSVIEDTVGFIRADVRNSGVRIETYIDADIPVLSADRILIEQVLINLIRNGAESMNMMDPDRKVLTVRARRTGPTVEIEIADFGTGIDPEIAGRLYDAFVSTKTEGMGMGLNICRSIVELHAGTLQHRSRPEGGTIFTVILPLRGEGDTA
jgi:two-component system, LuxR family, sensor histidine kinase DctS